MALEDVIERSVTHMRVALAQINTTVGDISGNTQRILEAIGAAQAAPSVSAWR